MKDDARTAALAKLREPFPPSAIGKLPKVTCKACTENKGECKDHKKARCRVCSAWVSTAHVDLDFVGHAPLTDRLLDADIEWSWEPMGYDEHGLPKLDAKGNLWIRLTVAGVTRPGVGDGPNAKEQIGDALRNAAMRFGAALDLWSKTDLPSHVEERQEPSPQPAHDEAKHRIVELVNTLPAEEAAAAQATLVNSGGDRWLDVLTEAQATKTIAWLEKKHDALRAEVSA